MPMPPKLWEKTPLKKFAEASLEKPGMYLIALRTHLTRGKSIIGKVFDTVTDAFPKSIKAGSPDSE